jgi:hypothetical protein
MEYEYAGTLNPEWPKIVEEKAGWSTNQNKKAVERT